MKRLGYELQNALAPHPRIGNSKRPFISPRQVWVCDTTHNTDRQIWQCQAIQTA